MRSSSNPWFQAIIYGVLLMFVIYTLLSMIWERIRSVSSRKPTHRDRHPHLFPGPQDDLDH